MAFEGEATTSLRGLGQDGFIRTVKNLTVTGDLVVHGETRSEKGEGTAFWEETDANANYWAYELPAGGATNVPVFGIGQGLDGVDLGLFDGITQTTFAVLDTDRDSFIAVDFSADDASRIRSNTTMSIVPTGALSVGTDGSGNDVIFYSGTAGDNLTWDSSEEVLQITGTNGQTSLDVLDGDVRIVDTLYFYDRGGESMSSDGSTLTIAGSVVFSGSIEVQGTTTTISSSTTVIDDPLFHLGNDNNADSVDLGIFAEYTDSGKKFSGLFRDASDSDKWKLFATSGNSHEEPTTTVNTTSGFTLANLAVNELEGTLATAAQANITSLGTLTALQVDYLNLNASTLQITDSTDTGDLMSIAVTTHGATTLTTTDDDAAAADLTLDVDGEIVIDPADAAGTIFKLNGTAQVNIIDGGIIPESTNDIDLGSASKEFKDAYFDGTVTSDAFSGPLSGNATTATALATGRTIAMTGDVAWTSASFDGSGNVTGAGTIQSTAVESGMLNDNVISGQTELAATGLAAEDELLVSDGGTIKRYGVDNLIKDSPALLADTTIADGDFIVFLDGGSTGTAKKEALADLVGVMAGTVTSTGLSDANSVLKLDIQNMTASTTIADADLIVIDDGAGGTLRKMTRANFIESAALDAINIDGGDISAVTISGGLTWSAAQNLNSQNLTNVNIDSGTIDAVTLGTNSAVTELQVDNININANGISSTDSNGAIYISPNGTGTAYLRGNVEIDQSGHKLIINNDTGIPAAATNRASMAAADYAAGDARFYIVTEAGNQLILGNGEIRWNTSGKILSGNGVLALDGTAGSSIRLNEAQANVDVVIESASQDNLMHFDASENSIGMFSAADTDTKVYVNFPAITAPADTSYQKMHLRSAGGALTVPTGTSAEVGTMVIDEPNITATGTVTTAFTLKVTGAPTEGGTNNYAFWVDDGDSRFDSDVQILDDKFLELGDGKDSKIMHSNGAISEDAEVTDLIVGTSVHLPTAANSLIVSNTTSDGDIAFFVSDGGNSKAPLVIKGDKGNVEVSNSLYNVQTMDIFNKGTNGTANYLIIWNDSDSQIGSVAHANGNETVYNTSSDYRIKENVVNLTGAVTRVKNLKPYRFNFLKAPSATIDGFFAHEAATVVPNAVTGIKDAVDDDDRIIPQGMDNSKLVPLLTAAIQELDARITALE